jgi:hypothetical protein
VANFDEAGGLDEWRPGSTLYSSGRQAPEYGDGPARLALRRDLGSLFSARPDDVLLVKASYRFSR